MIEISLNDKELLKYARKISYVIFKLPQDIQDRVINECSIIAIDDTEGEYKIIEHRHVIILNFLLMEALKESLRCQRHIIAHEIAHFILGDGSSDEDADRLAEEWGFTS